MRGELKSRVMKSFVIVFLLINISNGNQLKPIHILKKIGCGIASHLVRLDPCQENKGNVLQESEIISDTLNILTQTTNENHTTLRKERTSTESARNGNLDQFTQTDSATKASIKSTTPQPLQAAVDVDLQDDGIEIEHPQENYNGPLTTRAPLKKPVIDKVIRNPNRNTQQQA